MRSTRRAVPAFGVGHLFPDEAPAGPFRLLVSDTFSRDPSAKLEVQKTVTSQPTCNELPDNEGVEVAQDAEGRTKPVVDPDPNRKLLATAYHEAGHAVMAVSLGRTIKKVTIAPSQLQTGGFRLGLCDIQKGRIKASRDWLEDDVMILLAGMVAESHFTGSYCRSSAAHDLQAVMRLLGLARAANPRQLERIEQRLIDKTEHILGTAVHSHAVEFVTIDLMQKTTLRGRAVTHWFHQAQQQCNRSR